RTRDSSPPLVDVLYMCTLSPVGVGAELAGLARDTVSQLPYRYTLSRVGQRSPELNAPEFSSPPLGIPANSPLENTRRGLACFEEGFCLAWKEALRLLWQPPAESLSRCWSQSLCRHSGPAIPSSSPSGRRPGISLARGESYSTCPLSSYGIFRGR